MITYETLKNAVKNNEIEAVMCYQTRYRLFYNTDRDVLGYFMPYRKRHGHVFSDNMLDQITKIIYKKNVIDNNITNYNLVKKYRNLANKASFTNEFIRECQNLPNTYEEWVEDGKKTIYDYRITTGNRIDGNIISFKRISKKYPYAIQMLKNVIENKIPGEIKICSRVPFSGYEMTITTKLYENGDLMVWLALEYVNCGNGYYYLLINDDKFIGTDID